MALSLQTVKKILTSNKIVTPEEFDIVEKNAERASIPLLRFLIAQGKISQQKYLALVGKFLDIPVFDPSAQSLKLDMIGVLPEIIARQKQALVFAKDTKENIYRIAMVDPTDIDNINFLKEYLKGEIEPYLTSPESLRLGYQLYKQRSSENFETIIAEKINAVRTSLEESNENILENIPIVELVDTIIGYAATLDASDVYFQPQEEVLKIRFRIDGLLKDIIAVDRTINDGLVARTKTLAGLRIDEHFKPQDGRFRFRSSDIDLDVRVAVLPTIFGEKTTLRLLSGVHSFLTFEELGMRAEDIEKLHSVMKKPHGMILSTGPTGSGKTTTIYAMLYLLNKPETHIMTIEDPIEYIVPNVSQTQVNDVAGITFASGLRSMLRHSPDMIVVGEIRDKETTEISINAALTGHLVISTLHTIDAPSALIRLMDLGIQPFLIGATLNAVLGQRLARKICSNCKESYVPHKKFITSLEAQVKLFVTKKIEFPEKLYRGTGCSLCHKTGYHGRVGLFEIFMITESVRNLLGPNVTGEMLKRAAHEQNMTTIFEDGLQKVKEGTTTFEELVRVTSE